MGDFRGFFIFFSLPSSLTKIDGFVSVALGESPFTALASLPATISATIIAIIHYCSFFLPKKLPSPTFPLLQCFTAVPSSAQPSPSDAGGAPGATNRSAPEMPENGNGERGRLPGSGTARGRPRAPRRSGRWRGGVGGGGAGLPPFVRLRSRAAAARAAPSARSGLPPSCRAGDAGSRYRPRKGRRDPRNHPANRAAGHGGGAGTSPRDPERSPRI